MIFGLPLLPIIVDTLTSKGALVAYNSRRNKVSQTMYVSVRVILVYGLIYEKKKNLVNGKITTE